MNKELKREYKKEISEIKKQNVETLLLVLQYSILNILEATDNTKQSMEVLKEVRAITNEEKKLLKFIKNNINRMNSDSLDKMLDILDEVNEKTTQYYYYLLDNSSANMNIEKRYRRLETLIETSKYRKEVYGLTLGMKDIVKHLNYSTSFWTYILPHTIITENEEFYGVYLRIDEQKIVRNIRVIVPEITNLKTARINIHEFKHAYDMYNLLDIAYIEKDYEEVAKWEEERFEIEYVEEKVKRYFG